MSPSQSTDDRGASELVGVVLLFAFVFAGATLVFTFGMQASDALQGQTQVETAETSMQEVQSRLASLSSGSGESVKNFDISGANADDVTVVQEGNVTFQINGHTACTARMPMGSIVYEEDDTTVAYQAGGVWKQTQSGSSMVSAPALSYKKATVDGHPVYTIDFPMVNVDGSIDSGSVEAKKNATKSKQARKEMERSLCLRGPKTSKISENGVINVQNVTITVEGTRYYEAWSRYLQDEFGATATVKTFDANQSVVVANATLGQVTDSDDEATGTDGVEAYQNALFTVGNGELVLKNLVTVDSYNSEDDPYTTGDSNGRIVTDGSLTTQGQATIYGTAIVDGSVTLKAKSEITGDLFHNGTMKTKGTSSVGGSVSDTASVTAPSPVTGAVQSNLSTLSSENHNHLTDVIAGNTFNTSGELGAGQYYFENLQLDTASETLTLNASDGPIVIGVNNSVVVGTGSDPADPPEIHVEGDHQVVFFVRNSIEVNGRGKVTVEGDRSPQNWMYCTESCSVTFTSDTKDKRSKFTGVVYAPTKGGTGTVDINLGAAVYGAVVGGEATVKNHANLHFDRSLLDEHPPVVSLATDVGGPADGGDAIDAGDGGSEPNGSVGVNETVTVGDREYELESFDVSAQTLGTELSAHYEGSYDVARPGYGSYDFQMADISVVHAGNPEDELNQLDFWEWETSVADVSDKDLNGGVSLLIGVDCASGDCTGHYALDESSGATTATDSEGTLQDGNVIGAEAGVDGYRGNAFSFDNSIFTGAEYVDFDSGPGTVSERLADESFTVSAWVNEDADWSESTILSINRQNTNSQPLRLYTYGGDLYVEDSQTGAHHVGELSGTWSQVTASYDGTNITVYIDGTKRISYSTNVNLRQNDRVVLGATHDPEAFGGYYDGFSGKIDEFKIADSVVTPTTKSVGHYYETFNVTGRDDSAARDTITVDVEASEGDPMIQVIDPYGNQIAQSRGSGSAATLRFDVTTNRNYTVRIISETETPLEYNVTTKRVRMENVDYISSSPIQLQLETNIDGDETVYNPWPADESPFAGVDRDTNFPTVSETQTFQIEDVEGGASFTVLATSYFTDCDMVYAGHTEMVDGDTAVDLGCGTQGSERLSIDATSDDNGANVKVLRDGDKVPGVDAAGPEQRSFAEMLGPYVNDKGNLTLNDRQVVFLFELSDDDATFEDAYDDSGDPDYNDAVILYEFEDFEWNCVANCSDPETGDGGAGGGGGGGGGGDGGDGPAVSNPDGSLDGEGPQDNTYVIRITNSQVVVESESDSDD